MISRWLSECPIRTTPMKQPAYDPSHLQCTGAPHEFHDHPATPDPFLRELVIPFGAAGYVALFEIESNGIVSILAVRHQREDDYR